MRKIKIAPGEYYHIYNRGSGKKTIFHDKRDYIRFLFLILNLQSKGTNVSISRSVTSFVQHRVLNIEEQWRNERYVELVAFCIMPNHFHLIVKEVREGGISRYMQRALNSYSKYYNTRYQTSGHVFQGPYQYVHIQNDDQLMYVSAYIHRNPRSIDIWKNKEHVYEWSSYQDYITTCRFRDCLEQGVILNRENMSYKEFVQSSTAKLSKKEIAQLMFNTRC